MARYTIKYLTGDEDTIEANSVHIDVEGSQYVFHDQERKYDPVALVPQSNVLSVLRLQDETVSDR